MRRKDPPKASEIWNKSTPVFGAKTSFAEAFPTIEKLIIEVSESKGSHYRGHGWFYTETSTGEYIDCHNPPCYNGGIRIGRILRDMVEKGETERNLEEICQGYEGSPRGRRKYRDCLNFFSDGITIEYKKGG